MKRKVIIGAILILGLSGYYLYQRYFNEVEPVFSLNHDRLINYTYYRNYGNDQYLVDNWTLRYYHTDWTESVIWYEYGPFSVVFESPENNVVLKLSGVQVTPESPEFVYPLSIYQGDAYSVELSPFWSQNVSCNSLSDIELDSSGEYTVTMTGDAYPNGHRYSLKRRDDAFGTVEVYLYFQLVDTDGHVVKFRVDNRIWGARTSSR